MAKTKQQIVSTEPKVFIEIVGAVEPSESVIAANGKKLMTKCSLKIGDQIVGISNGAILPKTDPRFDGLDSVKTDVDGICFNIDRFTEIHAAIAFARIEWLGLDASTRKSFEEYVVSKDFSSVINVK
jgi:hypothetical protein